MSIAKNLRAGGKMFLLSAIAVGMALPAYAQSQGGFNSTTPSVTFSAEGTGVLTLKNDSSAAFAGPVSFGGPITLGGTTINRDGSMVVGSTNGAQTSPTLVVNGPIEPGTSNIATGNSCTMEGALGYDLSRHTPVYCSDVGVWTVMGGTPTATETLSCFMGNGEPGGVTGNCHFDGNNGSTHQYIATTTKNHGLCELSQVDGWAGGMWGECQITGTPGGKWTLFSAVYQNQVGCVMTCYDF